MTEIHYLYPFVLILLSLYASTYYLKRDVAFLVAPTLIFISLFIYLFSIFGLFQLANYLVFLFIIMAFILSLVKSRFKNSYFFNRNLLYLSLVILFIIIWNFKRYFYQWDEFSHWGLMVKEMFRLNDLYSINTSNLIAHKDYPPIIPILETFWLKLNRTYNEPAIYQVLQFLGFSYFLPLLSKRKFNFMSFILFLTTLVLFQGLFDLEDAKFFLTIYLDPILFLTFAYFIFSIYSFEDNKLNNFIIMLIGSFLLLMKEMGLFLYIIGFTVWFIQKVSNGFKKKELFINSVQWIIPILFLGSWKIYFAQFDYVGQFSVTQINLLTFLDIVKGSGGFDWQIQAFNNFIQSLFSMNILIKPFNFNYVLMILVFSIIILVLSFMFNRKDKKDFFRLGLILILFSFAYAFVMLLLYVFSFGEFEGPRLASNMRYLSSYWYGIGAIFLMIFISKIDTNKKLLIQLSALIIVLVGLFFNPVNYQRIQAGLNGVSVESYFTHDLERLRSETENNSKVFFIAQDQNASYLNYFRYLVNDRKFNVEGFNIGEIIDENDVWKWDYSSNEFISELKDYDYLYIYHMNDEFYERFYKIMPDNFYVSDHQLLKIIREGNSVVFQILYPNATE